MSWARSPLRVRWPTTSGWKRLSCQSTRGKYSSGRLCARAADSIMRQRDSRTSTFPVRAGGGGGAGGDAAGGASAVAGGGGELLSAGAAGVVAAGGDVASLPVAGGALLPAGAARGARGTAVSGCCARAGAPPHSLRAKMAIRALRRNRPTPLIAPLPHPTPPPPPPTPPP